MSWIEFSSYEKNNLSCALTEEHGVRSSFRPVKDSIKNLQDRAAESEYCASEIITRLQELLSQLLNRRSQLGSDLDKQKNLKKSLPTTQEITVITKNEAGEEVKTKKTIPVNQEELKQLNENIERIEKEIEVISKKINAVDEAIGKCQSARSEMYFSRSNLDSAGKAVEYCEKDLEEVCNKSSGIADQAEKAIREYLDETIFLSDRLAVEKIHRR